MIWLIGAYVVIGVMSIVLFESHRRREWRETHRNQHERWRC